MGERKGRSRRWIAAAALSLLGIVAAEASAAEPDWDAAWQTCKKDAVNQLKAPATAKFDNISLKQVKPPSIGVYFSVDSENSYGALLRSWSVCVFNPDSPSSTAALLLDALKESVMGATGDPSYQHRPPE